MTGTVESIKRLERKKEERGMNLEKTVVTNLMAREIVLEILENNELVKTAEESNSAWLAKKGEDEFLIGSYE